MRYCLTRALGMAVLVTAAFLGVCAVRTWFGMALPDCAEASVKEPVISQTPLTEEELCALRWLDYVTGKLPPNEECEWWDVQPVKQFGLFAQRYNIAFAGYAAAALGMRGNAAEREIVGRILGNCVERMLRRNIWAYSQAKNYWGKKPWAPDPCFRENVMYTGHLLQLLAFYEWFTGNRKYWEKGFDFVWRDGRSVHYDVKRLIDVTVEQMRASSSGGIACEPGLMFFPCNNHPHIALGLFSRLGYGNWANEAKRWEQWALPHYLNPIFGGGALNLVCHVKTGVMYPRGHNGLDGWSLLWYEPWAMDRSKALALWRECVKRLDWEMLEMNPDAQRGYVTCATPVNVPPIATVSFLAAGARACDDDETAKRLEKIADRSLVHKDGMSYLNVGREWRIGATANRIIAMAIGNGSSFRAFLRQ